MLATFHAYFCDLWHEYPKDTPDDIEMCVVFSRNVSNPFYIEWQETR